MECIRKLKTGLETTFQEGNDISNKIRVLPFLTRILSFVVWDVIERERERERVRCISLRDIIP